MILAGCRWGWDLGNPVLTVSKIFLTTTWEYHSVAQCFSFLAVKFSRHIWRCRKTEINHVGVGYWNSWEKEVEKSRKFVFPSKNLNSSTLCPLSKLAFIHIRILIHAWQMCWLSCMCKLPDLNLLRSIYHVRDINSLLKWTMALCHM